MDYLNNLYLIPDMSEYGPCENHPALYSVVSIVALRKCGKLVRQFLLAYYQKKMMDALVGVDIANQKERRR